MFEEYLKSFGLTGQEAAIYEALLTNGAMTGYEAAKATGISRSYVYGALAALVDKGAAYLIDGETSRYTAESVDRFCENALHDLRAKAEYLKAHAPKKREETDCYVTITGRNRIHNKVHAMLDSCRQRVYLMAGSDILADFSDSIARLVGEGKKVVLMSDGYSLEGAVNLRTETKPGQIRMITDSTYVLTGTYGEGEFDTCLFSGSSNIVAVMKEALGTRIQLIEMEDKES